MEEVNESEYLKRLRHDLLNELNVIVGNVDLIRMDNDCPEHDESLTEITEAAARAREQFDRKLN